MIKIVQKAKTAVALTAAVAAPIAAASVGHAQTIGAQIGTTAQEMSTAGGFIASTAMYGGALAIFIAAVWALWQSRQPENRESGKLAMGLCGLVITGLLATGGAWIGKASQSVTGAAATITSTAGVVGF